MANHFNPKEFVRKIPADLLRAYCDRKALAIDFPWDEVRSVDPQAFLAALKREGDDSFESAVADFKLIWDMSDRGFTEGVLNEARFYGDHDALEAIESQRSHLTRAFWVFLERPDYINNGWVIRNVDRIPPGRWIKRRGMPLRPGPMDQAMIVRLQGALVEFFTEHQFRGQSCKIDCLRRGDEEILFAYSQDHPTTSLCWENGELVPMTMNPSFSFVLKHHDAE